MNTRKMWRPVFAWRPVRLEPPYPCVVAHGGRIRSERWAWLRRVDRASVMILDRSGYHFKHVYTLPGVWTWWDEHGFKEDLTEHSGEESRGE